MSTKITFIADTHHFSPTLTDEGRAFQLRSGSDQKCLIETGAIIDASFDYIANSDTQAVMLAGDVSDDGERVSHEELREKLYKLQQKKPVYLITATHDWCCDENPRGYFGEEETHDIPTIPHEELREFYFDFGPKQALSEYITHLGVVSYTVDLSDEVRLLAINDDQSGVGHAGYSDEHFAWIKEQIAKAKEDGKVMLGMEHHLILPHVHPIISAFGMRVGYPKDAATLLADAGLKYMFVGHSHIHRVTQLTTEAGNTITQVNVGSLVGYPSSIVNVTVDGEKVTIDTVCTPTFEFKGTKNTEQYLEEHLYGLVDNIIYPGASKDTKEFQARLRALGIKGKANETIGKFHWAIRPIIKYITKAKVKNAYRLVKLVTFGTSKISKKDAKEYWDVPVMDFIHDCLRNVIGGTPVPHEADSAYCRLLKAVVSVPKFYVRKNKFCRELPDLAESLVTGGKFNNYHDTISDVR